MNLAAAALRAGCTVRSSSSRRTRIECINGWGAARLLVELAREDLDGPKGAELLRLGRELRRDRDELAFVGAVHDFVQTFVAFVRDEALSSQLTNEFREPMGLEIFDHPHFALSRGAGDCDAHARIVAALARAGGLRARFVFFAPEDGGNPTHVTAQVFAAGMWRWVETTVAARLGEQPIAAALRLQIVGREDIGPQFGRMVIMGEEVFGPVSENFGDANPQELVELDATVLGRLGFVNESEVRFERVEHPALATWFRRAVARAQQAAKGKAGKIDGEIGPKTRAWLSTQIPLDEFGMGYAAAIAPRGVGIGGIGATSIGPTKHLSSKFWPHVVALAKRFNDRGSPVAPEDFLKVWLGESGILTARQGIAAKDYYGLNMMHEKYIRALGWGDRPIEGYRDLEGEEQIPYVERFYESNVKAFLGGDWTKLRNAAGLYLMNFTPAFSSHANEPNFVISQKDDPRWGWIWRDNRGFDPENKGYIEVADIDRWIERAIRQQSALWNEALRRLRDEGGASPSSLGGGSGGVIPLIAAAPFIGLAYFVGRELLST